MLISRRPASLERGDPGRHQRRVVRAGLVPVSIGLLAASAFLIARASGHDWIDRGIMAAIAATAYWTRLNPLWMFAGAGLIGLAASR
jgi:chromate transporter